MWPSHCLAPTRFSTAEVGARHEPGETRVGPRARRARLTKSGAAPCGRATGNPVDAGASGRDLKPESDLTFPALPAPAGLSPSPVGLSVSFSRRTSLPLAWAAPAKGKPQLRALGAARRCPAPATGAAGARPRRPQRQRLSTRLPAAAGHPGSGAAALQDLARAPLQSDRSLHPAPRPMPYPGSQRKERPANGSSKGGGGVGARPRLERSRAEGSRSHNGRAQAPSPPPPAP